MRVGIALARRAVGGPAGMRDAQPADQRGLLLRLLEFGNLARAPQALQLAMAVQHGQAGAVVTAVLQALEAFEKDGGDVAFGDGAHDATHDQFSCWCSGAAQISLTPRA